MKKFLSLICILLCGVVLFGACGEKKTLEEIKSGALATTEYPSVPTGGQEYREYLVENAIDEDFADALAEFSYKTVSLLFPDLSNVDTLQNINYSPASMFFAMNIVTAGAVGDTQSELKDFLCTKGFTDEKISEQMGKLYRLLYNSTESNQVEIANSLWLNKNLSVKQNFIDNAVQNYYAELYSVDFAISQTAKDMGSWVYNKTHKKLNPEFKTSAETLLWIINTVYFSSAWSVEFDKELTEEDDFYLYTGETDSTNSVLCDFMHRTSTQSIVIGENYSRISLPFSNGAKMNFLLPDEGCLQDFLTDYETLQSAFTAGNSYFGDVVISLPKFSFTNKFTQKDFGVDTLKAFSPTQSDFSLISDISSYISSLTQETFIEINEEKVEAAAYTAIGTETTSVGPEVMPVYEFNCNRPFIFSITYNGVILFTGVVFNPAAQ